MELQKCKNLGLVSENSVTLEKINCCAACYERWIPFLFPGAATFDRKAEQQLADLFQGLAFKAWALLEIQDSNFGV